MNYPPQGYYPPPPPPRKRSKGWLWITLGVVALVIAGVAFTGWVKPGFFVEKDTTSDATAAQTAQSFTNAVSASEPFSQLLCEYRSKRTYAAEQVLSGVSDAQLTGAAHQRTADEQSATISAGGGSWGLAIAHRGPQWCVRDIKSGGEPEPLPSQSGKPGPRPQVTDGADAAAKFVAALNARDVPAALALLCKDVPATTRDGAQQVANGEPKYTVKNTDVLTSARLSIAHLEGELDGVAGVGRVETDDAAVSGPCVTTFSPDSD